MNDSSDLTTNLSPKEFRFRVSQNRDFLATAIADGSRSDSDKQTALVRVLRYLDVQLSRAVGSIDKEADLMAGVLRSLIELRYWVNFISQSPENATQFLHEKSIDERELFDHLKIVYPSDAELFAMPLIPGKRIRIEPKGAHESFIWKLCSKLIHPSSFVITAVRLTYSVLAASNSCAIS